jgi:hypothetical protein
MTPARERPRALSLAASYPCANIWPAPGARAGLPVPSCRCGLVYPTPHVTPWPRSPGLWTRQALSLLLQPSPATATAEPDQLCASGTPPLSPPHPTSHPSPPYHAYHAALPCRCSHLSNHRLSRLCLPRVSQTVPAPTANQPPTPPPSPGCAASSSAAASRGAAGRPTPHPIPPGLEQQTRDRGLFMRPRRQSSGPSNGRAIRRAGLRSRRQVSPLERAFASGRGPPVRSGRVRSVQVGGGCMLQPLQHGLSCQPLLLDLDHSTMSDRKAWTQAGSRTVYLARVGLARVATRIPKPVRGGGARRRGGLGQGWTGWEGGSG